MTVTNAWVAIASTLGRCDIALAGHRSGLELFGSLAECGACVADDWGAVSEAGDVHLETREPAKRLDGFLSCNVERSEDRPSIDGRDIVAGEEHA